MLKRIYENFQKIKDVDADSVPYVVLVGNIGVGKSTTVEKLTGLTGLSSNASESFTRQTAYHWVADKSLLIADTPGANPLEEKLQHNMQIANALNYDKVSKFLIVAKAELRLGESIHMVRQYADRFVVLPLECVGVLITHMDRELEWTEQEFTKACDKNLGISDVVYTAEDTTGEALLKKILSKCSGPKHKLDIDCELFFRMFEFHDSNRRILKVTGDIVNRFRMGKAEFDAIKDQFSSNKKEEDDLFFEFKSFMEQEVDLVKEEVSRELGFDFYGDEGLVQAGHIANMVNQIRAIIYDIRMEALALLNDADSNDLRRCPRCDRVWAKVEGCDGPTTCGNRPTMRYDSDYSVFATFTFQLSRDGKLSIRKSGERSLISPETSTEQLDGCGASITWSSMKRIPPNELPEGFRVVPEKVNTDDIMCLPRRARCVAYINQQLGKAATYIY